MTLFYCSAMVLFLICMRQSQGREQFGLLGSSSRQIKYIKKEHTHTHTPKSGTVSEGHIIGHNSKLSLAQTHGGSMNSGPKLRCWKDVDAYSWNILFRKYTWFFPWHNICHTLHFPFPSAIPVRSCVTIWRQVQHLPIMCSLFISYPMLGVQYSILICWLEFHRSLLFYPNLFNLVHAGFWQCQSNMKLKWFHFESL